MNLENNQMHQPGSRTDSNPCLEDKAATVVATVTWGPWLFRVIALVSLIFVWWMVIDDHGIAPTH